MGSRVRVPSRPQKKSPSKLKGFFYLTLLVLFKTENQLTSMRHTILLLISLLVISCAGAEDNDTPTTPAPVVRYNVSISASAGGTVSPQGGSYERGASITLTATPAANYIFLGWSNGSLENPLTLVVNGEINLTANFGPVENPVGGTSGSTSVTLVADGETDTYALITSVLAPGASPVEAPDCNHDTFGPHIDQVFDNDLNKYVFRFYMHVSPDNDRCINFDRQRNEIKTYDQSPEDRLGRLNEQVTYRWKFKLADGFQVSPKFTHIHQLKSVGGEYESMPMYTLTLRKGTPDRLELRYAETDSQVTLDQTALAPFINQWISVEETIDFRTSGAYNIVLKVSATEEVLFSYSNDAKINWRPEAEFVRPKWGIYRSLLYPEDIRDETLLFADFSIAENN